ncbi:MAG: hydroxymethylbilane synthase [Thermoplasmata archaeon]
MTERVRVATRRSRLARVQTELILTRLTRAEPTWSFVPVPIDTSGDRDTSPGDSPDFTDAIDHALREGEVDLAVHSAKDLPAELDAAFELVACPRRADPRDCLVVAPDTIAYPLPHGARVGSSSLRRRAQLLRWRPDLDVVDIRGNVDTRIGLLGERGLDAVILAVAGIHRLRRAKEITRILPTSTFLPAPAQGALAVLARADDTPVVSAVRRINHPATFQCISAERSFAAALGGDCRVPLGALATHSMRTVSLVGEVLNPAGQRHLRRRRVGPASEGKNLGSNLGKDMLKEGALELLGAPRR